MTAAEDTLRSSELSFGFIKMRLPQGYLTKQRPALGCFFLPVILHADAKIGIGQPPRVVLVPQPKQEIRKSDSAAAKQAGHFEVGPSLNVVASLNAAKAAPIRPRFPRMVPRYENGPFSSAASACLAAVIASRA